MTTNLPPSADLWELAVSRNSARLSFITSRDEEALQPAREDGPPSSKLFDFLKQRNAFVDSTNFTEREILAFFLDSQPSFAKMQTRGRHPKIDTLDSIILLLHWLRTGLNFKTIATNSGYGETATRSAIMRAKEGLFDHLMEKWWSRLDRPTPLEGTAFPYVAMLCDSTSIEVFRPVGHFSEAKVYFDGKNKYYALKKEVCVSASPPHYAFFSSPAFVGSEHDYSAFKKGYERYKDYLKKTPQERHMLPRDSSEASWAILCDSGYTGDLLDVPGLRKIALKKRTTMFPSERREQQELSRLRVPVECFFGRLQKLWAVLRDVYRSAFQINTILTYTYFRWDHTHFDKDFDLCVLLTNEHIRANRISPEDRLFLEQLNSIRQEAVEGKAKKRRLQQQQYASSQRARLGL